MPEKKWEAMLDELLENEDAGLGGKEIDFLDSLDQRYREKDELSPKQEEWLQRIWNRVFSR
jgi:hypothetical protein